MLTLDWWIGQLSRIIYASLKLQTFLLWLILARDSKQYCDAYWIVATPALLCSHRSPSCHKIIFWSINCNTRHAHLAAQCLNSLHLILHHIELWYKHWCLNWFLPLAEPNYWGTVKIHEYAVLRSSCLSVTIIISFNKTICRHEVASCNWYIPWDRLLRLPIKFYLVHWWTLFSLMTGCAMLKTNFFFVLTFKYPKIWNAC